METWFWVLAWFLSILTMAGNGFIIFLVCYKRQLRTKTNTLIVSLAVADFCVGMIAVPSRFLCGMVNKCITSEKAIFIGIYVRVFFVYASGSNLYSLAFERYIAVAKPLKYLTFMTSRRVIQMVLTSWAIPFLSAVILFSMTLNSLHRISAYFHLFFEIILCVIFIFCVASMFLVVYKNSKNRISPKQMQLNKRFAKVKAQNTSAVKWLALVTCVFLSCYGLFMHCSLLSITGHQCEDFHYKVPLQVMNSGINPIVYALFKRDIEQECKRLFFKRRLWLFLKAVLRQEKLQLMNLVITSS